MTFQPYHCLHVPVKTVGLLARLVGFWPSWLVLALAAVLAYRTWGAWVLFVPVLVLIVAGVVVLWRDFTAARETASVSVATNLTVAGTAVLVAPVTATSVHICRRCDACRATLMITMRGEPIPACDACQMPVLHAIYQAATTAALEPAVACTSGGR